jgi:D-beta-D-heptose 7-phosphate kinase/D-beta-D-heptose 1-phosphate adenosyltransferase
MDFSNIAVLCVGDVMLDRFVYGEMERISPEAPVPVLRLTRTREMLGGAGNVANNIASLGGQAVLVGLLGADGPGDTVRRLAAGLAGVTGAFVDTAERPTICKTRFIATRQQVVRADEESLLPLQQAEQVALRAAIARHLPAVRAVILSDYGKGLLSRELIDFVIDAARQAGIPVFVDPKTKDFGLYRGASCITPNLRELAAASGLPIGTDEEVLAAARQVMDHSGAAAILATRSERGMLLAEASGEWHSVPARAREVFDVSGAGDTVIATLALAHASGRTLLQAMHIANAAAGVVVSKLGTATADVAEVVHELAAQETDQHAPPAQLQPLSRVQGLVAGWKEQGLTVGFTNGCFDILHPGHVSLLAAARAQCDRLVVALNTDDSVRRLKGPTRPVNRLQSRAQVIAALRHVDCVTSFDEDTPLELIRVLLPDVLVKGGDYTREQVVGGDLVTAAGGRVMLARIVEGESTTGTIARLQAFGRTPAEVG